MSMRTDGAAVTHSAHELVNDHDGGVEPLSESGVKRKADPNAVARLGARLEMSAPKWRKLYHELKRRDPKGHLAP